MKFILILLLQFVFASDLIVIEIDGTSDNQEPAQAKQEIVNKAIEKDSRDNIDLILDVQEAQKK
ncbi:MAG: hypothetical protein KDD37_09240, partial [Bdellovibrionales bacterium]|nr:hypothetical protein [Bdellovibrionales bacterium]